MKWNNLEERMLYNYIQNTNSILYLFMLQFNIYYNANINEQR